MTSIDKQKWRLLQSKAKVFDEIAKSKPMANGEIKKSAPSLLDWYEDDPEAFFGAVIEVAEWLDTANNHKLAGMRQRYRTQKRRRSPGSGKTAAKRKRRTDRDDEASSALDDGGSAPDNNWNGDDDLL